MRGVFFYVSIVSSASEGSEIVSSSVKFVDGFCEGLFLISKYLYIKLIVIVFIKG